jgi:hypothetical protein
MYTGSSIPEVPPTSEVAGLVEEEEMTCNAFAVPSSYIWLVWWGGHGVNMYITLRCPTPGRIGD